MYVSSAELRKELYTELCTENPVSFALDIIIAFGILPHCYVVGTVQIDPAIGPTLSIRSVKDLSA